MENKTNNYRIKSNSTNEIPSFQENQNQEFEKKSINKTQIDRSKKNTVINTITEIDEIDKFENSETNGVAKNTGTKKLNLEEMLKLKENLIENNIADVKKKIELTMKMKEELESENSKNSLAALESFSELIKQKKETIKQKINNLVNAKNEELKKLQDANRINQLNENYKKMKFEDLKQKKNEDIKIALVKNNIFSLKF